MFKFKKSAKTESKIEKFANGAKLNTQELNKVIGGAINYNAGKSNTGSGSLGNGGTGTGTGSNLSGTGSGNNN